jgi:hypothetical protein
LSGGVLAKVLPHWQKSISCAQSSLLLYLTMPMKPPTLTVHESESISISSNSMCWPNEVNLKWKQTFLRTLLSLFKHFIRLAKAWSVNNI